MTVGYIIFGAATLIESVSPISSRCSESISASGISQVQILTLHDVASIVAAFGQLFALISSKRLLRSTEQSLKLYKKALSTYWIWI